MSDATVPPLWAVVANTFAIIVSISLLAYLFVVIPSSCAMVMQASGGKTTCGIEPGAYVIGAALVVIVLWAGFYLFGMLFPTKKGSCRICSLISKR